MVQDACFKIIPALFGLLSDKADHVFVLDELDRSLHTQLSYKLMELFLENSGNRKSQLIVTTHDTSLLDLDLLRRDEIWFLEKDRLGVSSLFSLEEFELSKKHEHRKGIPWWTAWRNPCYCPVTINLSGQRVTMARKRSHSRGKRGNQKSGYL